MTEKKNDEKGTPDALPGAPAAPPKKATTGRTETLFIAYITYDTHLGDVAVFGTKLGALEFAMEQEPPWKVTPAMKGDRLSDLISV